MDDDKIFLETDLLYAKYKIGFAMVGADGKAMEKKKKKKRLEQPHLRPRGCEIRRLSNEDGMEPWALTQEKMKGL